MDDDVFDLGATEVNGKLRLWRAKEALRQGEAYLKAQGETLSGLRTRATAVLGWTVTGFLALAAALLTGRFIAAAMCVTLTMTIAAAYCLKTLWPSSFNNPAWPPAWVMDHPLESELEMLEAMAQGAAHETKEDERKLLGVASSLRIAYLALAAAPVIGAIVLLVSLFWPGVDGWVLPALRASAQSSPELHR